MKDFRLFLCRLGNNVYLCKRKVVYQYDYGNNKHYQTEPHSAIARVQASYEGMHPARCWPWGNEENNKWLWLHSRYSRMNTRRLLNWTMSLLIEMVSDSSRSAEVCEGYYQLLVSIYFKNNNPNKQQLIKSFNDLMSRDIYEIVVWLYSIKSLYTLFI